MQHVLQFVRRLSLTFSIFFLSQDLCRQHMAAKSSLGRQDCGVGAAGGAGSGGGGGGGGGGTDTSRVSSVSSQFSDAPQPSPSSHSSTPSWCEEPAQSNMDISTGHMILVDTHTPIYKCKK